MSNSRNLELPFVEEGQAQKHVTVNDAFRRIDSVVQLAVIERERSAPPASPQEGDRYLVGASPSGPWAGHPRDVAAYIDGAWEFFSPVEGWLAYVQSENALAFFNGAAWEVLTATSGVETVARLGINTAADAINRLAVRSRAALFAPDPAASDSSVRIIATKGDDDATVSHVFQTNLSGRAEFGLIASDDFSLKVSADGTAFREAFRVDRTSAEVDFRTVPRIGGSKGLALSLSSRAALGTNSVPADVGQVETRGYALENDGGGARYRRTTSLPADGLGIADAGGGFWALEGSEVNVRQAGAVGDGIADDTLAINRAMASGRIVRVPAGQFRVTNALRTSATFQRITGAGRGRAIILMPPSFPTAAPGVFSIEHQFVTLEDIEIRFDQSGASSRATLVQYPPAVRCAGQPRTRLLRLRFTEAYVGVDASGNCGGSIFEDIESGSLNLGFLVAGSLDTVELRNCRVWPYNFAGNGTLLNIYSDGVTIGFRIGRCDDLKMTNCTPFRARIIFERTDGSAPFGTVHGLALDGSYSRVEMSDGNLSISGVYCTSADPNDFAVLVTGGSLVLSDFSFRFGSIANLPIVHVNGQFANCQISNGQMEIGQSLQADGFRLTAGQLAVNNVRFSVAPDSTRGGSCIRQIGGVLQATANTCTRVTTGSGAFISIATNGDHVVVGNNSGGWRYDLPTPTTLGLYGPNHDTQGVTIANVVRFAPSLAGTTEGGEIQLLGAGTNNHVSIDNQSGNARVFGLATGRALQVVTADGTASIGGVGLELSNSFRVGRGLADEAFSVGLGSLALASTTLGGSNVAIGRRALTALTTGSASVAIGGNAGAAATTADGNTFVGFAAGSTLTGANNTAIGQNTFAGAPPAVTNSTALGNGATVQGSNEVQLGNSATTTYVYGSVASRSDARDKADVRETALGLDFLMRLRPVDFRWDYREDYTKPSEWPDNVAWEAPVAGSLKRSRYHHGFLAQDVAAAAADLGADFGGYQDHTIAGGGDVRTLGYSEFIAPIVRAIQTLAERLAALEER